MQHHPLGKASRTLHKSARDRVNKAIGAMLDGPNQKDKLSPLRGPRLQPDPEQPPQGALEAQRSAATGAGER
jgi:hypothetical protein